MASAEQTASNGKLALERLQQRHYDVVLLDVAMPEMDGVETLRHIHVSYPDVAVVMISFPGEECAMIMESALEMGALDYIVKPRADSPEKSMELIATKLKSVFSLICTKHERKKRLTAISFVRETAKQETVVPEKKAEVQKKPFVEADLIVIASSTGGPAALEKVCKGFSSELKKPILIVQHLTAEFTPVLAKTLDAKCPLSVVEATSGSVIRSGQILIAPGGKHMLVKNDGGLHMVVLEDTLPVHGVKPSADKLFIAVAEAYAGASILAVVLTGMGQDGALGVREMKQHCHCYCLAQSEKSCVVYGMPRCVVETGLAEETVDIEEMAGRIMQLAGGR